MYRPSMYQKHDETMLNFAELFNNCHEHRHILMRPNPEETFDNDGVFVDVNTNNSIGFDWEYRDAHFANCHFDFNSLGQYERKLQKPSIQLSIQCDSTVTGIAVGWHEDWLSERKEMRSLLTDSIVRERGTIRYTKKFRIYSFEQVNIFKAMIANAMRMRIYSSKIFESVSGFPIVGDVGD